MKVTMFPTVLWLFFSLFSEVILPVPPQFPPIGSACRVERFCRAGNRIFCEGSGNNCSYRTTRCTYLPGVGTFVTAQGYVRCNGDFIYCSDGDESCSF